MTDVRSYGPLGLYYKVTLICRGDPLGKEQQHKSHQFLLLSVRVALF